MYVFVYKMKSMWLATLLFLCFVKIENASPAKGKAGPYKISLLSTRRCVRHRVPYETDPSAFLHLETYNSTNGVLLMRGNFTFLKDTSRWKGTAKQFVWANGKWKSNLVLHSSGCQGIFITILVSLLRVDFDFKHCTVKLGTYVVNGLDINKVGHLWTPTQIYGKEMWRDEVISPDGLVDCWEFFDLVEPL